jgi:hypothetical protein
MKNYTKFFTFTLGISILVTMFTQVNVLAERNVSPQLVRILELSENSECPSDERKLSVPTLNGHSYPACILFYAAVDVDDGSTLRTWNFTEGKGNRYVSGKLKKGQTVYVIMSNKVLGKQPAVLIGIPEEDNGDPVRFATVELRYLRYLR